MCNDVCNDGTRATDATPRDPTVTSDERTTSDAPPAVAGARPPVWRKSSASNPQGNCVELAVLPDGGVAIRNSRFPAGPQITYTRAEIAAFVHGVRAGEFNDLLA